MESSALSHEDSRLKLEHQQAVQRVQQVSTRVAEVLTSCRHTISEAESSVAALNETMLQRKQTTILVKARCAELQDARSRELLSTSARVAERPRINAVSVIRDNIKSIPEATVTRLMAMAPPPHCRLIPRNVTVIGNKRGWLDGESSPKWLEDVEQAQFGLPSISLNGLLQSALKTTVDDLVEQGRGTFAMESAQVEKEAQRTLTEAKRSREHLAALIAHATQQRQQLVSRDTQFGPFLAEQREVQAELELARDVLRGERSKCEAAEAALQQHETATGQSLKLAQQLLPGLEVDTLASAAGALPGRIESASKRLSAAVEESQLLDRLVSDTLSKQQSAWTRCLAVVGEWAARASRHDPLPAEWSDPLSVSEMAARLEAVRTELSSRLQAEEAKEHVMQERLAEARLELERARQTLSTEQQTLDAAKLTCQEWTRTSEHATSELQSQMADASRQLVDALHQCSSLAGYGGRMPHTLRFMPSLTDHWQSQAMIVPVDATNTFQWLTCDPSQRTALAVKLEALERAISSLWDGSMSSEQPISAARDSLIMISTWMRDSPSDKDPGPDPHLGQALGKLPALHRTVCDMIDAHREGLLSLREMASRYERMHSSSSSLLGV
jgi:hypothetical protein